jgi:cytochrome b6-f complex iron-sulfur subunit
MQDQHNSRVVDNFRRKLIKKGLKFLPLIGVGAFTYPLIKFVNFEEVDTISFAIPLSKIDKKITKKNKVLIYKNAKGIKVYDAHCTHMGCVLNFDEKSEKFLCPCHGSEFSITGVRLKGPAKRDLDIISSRIENNILYIG